MSVNGYFDRLGAKYRARMAMRGSYPHPMMVTLVYTLLTVWLANLLMGYVADPFSIAVPYLLDGADLRDVLRYIFTPGRVTAYLLMELLITLYQWVMQYGYTAYALGLARRTGPGYRTLLEGFSHLGRALGVSFLTTLFISLWGVLVMVPGIVVLSAGAMLESFPLIMFSSFLMFAGSVVPLIVSYRYRLAVYFLLDEPDMGVLTAIRESKETMRGRKWQLFVMDLTFLGWVILTVLTLGVVGLWAEPYIWVTEANFYHWARWGAFPGEGGQPGGYQSPYQNL